MGDFEWAQGHGVGLGELDLDRGLGDVERDAGLGEADLDRGLLGLGEADLDRDGLWAETGTNAHDAVSFVGERWDLVAFSKSLSKR